jgi:hypothetical protein
MRICFLIILAFGFGLAVLPARAGDEAARALVARAVKAHGGQATLAKYPAVSGKFKGTFHGLGDALAVTGDFAAYGANRTKFAIEGVLDGQKFLLAQVLDGDKGWYKLNDDTEELDEEALAEAKEEAYVDWVASLAPLRDKQFRLVMVGDIQIEKRPARGVTVSCKDHRDVNLYFDKESGLLVKTEARVKDDNGQEVTEETMLSEYKEVQGTKQAMRMTLRRDGKLYLESEITEIRLEERLDASVFGRP